MTSVPRLTKRKHSAMSGTRRSPVSARSRPKSSPSPTPSLLVPGETDPECGSARSVTPVALTVKEEQMQDDLALLFTVQEERGVSRASREYSQLSTASLTSSRLAEVAFIYQHIDFQVLARCVPAFVKSHLNKNGRYLPESFILRVNHWRRRRGLGDDFAAKRAARENAAKENAAKENAAKENAAKENAAKENVGKSPDERSTPVITVTSAKSTRPQSVSSKQTSWSGSHVTMISG